MRFPYSSTYFLHHNHPKSCGIICTLPPPKIHTPSSGSQSSSKSYCPSNHTQVFFSCTPPDTRSVAGCRHRLWRPPPIGQKSHSRTLGESEIRDAFQDAQVQVLKPQDVCHLGRAYKPVTIKVHCWFPLRINQI